MIGAVLTAVLVSAAGLAHADKRVDEAYARAESQIEKGKPDDAIKTVEKLPPGPEAQLALARVLWRTNNAERATAATAKAAELAGTADRSRGEGRGARRRVRT